jgi:hypothetical protein
MKGNARHVPGSNRNCRTALSLSATPTRRSQALPGKCVHYAYKMRPNFKTQILICSTPMTYVFNPQKCTHFSVHPTPTHDPNPASRDPAAETHNHRMPLMVESRPFSLGEKVRMRDKLVISAVGNLLPSYCTIKVPERRSCPFVSIRGCDQNGKFRDEFPFCPVSTTSYQRLTTTPSSPVPFYSIPGNETDATECTRSERPLFPLPRAVEAVVATSRLRCSSLPTQNRTKQNDFKNPEFQPRPTKHLRRRHVQSFDFRFEWGLVRAASCLATALDRSCFPLLVASSEIRSPEVSTK